MKDVKKYFLIKLIHPPDDIIDIREMTHARVYNQIHAQSTDTDLHATISGLAVFAILVMFGHLTYFSVSVISYICT